MAKRPCRALAVHGSPVKLSRKLEKTFRCPLRSSIFRQPKHIFATRDMSTEIRPIKRPSIPKSLSRNSQTGFVSCILHVAHMAVCVASVPDCVFDPSPTWSIEHIVSLSGCQLFWCGSFRVPFFPILPVPISNGAPGYFVSAFLAVVRLPLALFPEIHIALSFVWLTTL